jgi:hypothetical protein
LACVLLIRLQRKLAWCETLSHRRAVNRRRPVRRRSTNARHALLPTSLETRREEGTSGGGSET